MGAAEADVPTALYRQDGDLVWAEFASGAASRVEFAYTMVLDGGEIVAGHSVNTPQVLPDGRITSAGNRNPANADFSGGEVRGRTDSFTAQARLDLACDLRNGTQLGATTVSSPRNRNAGGAVTP